MIRDQVLDKPWYQVRDQIRSRANAIIWSQVCYLAWDHVPDDVKDQSFRNLRDKFK